MPQLIIVDTLGKLDLESSFLNEFQQFKACIVPTMSPKQIRNVSLTKTYVPEILHKVLDTRFDYVSS